MATINEMEMVDGSIKSSVIVRNAYKRYSTNIVLYGLNMTVPEGCIYGLLGPSGCGKTTLLNCIVGRTKLDVGTVEVKVDTLSRIGYMPQFLSIHFQMTIYENISFYGYLFGLSKEVIKCRIKELISYLDLPSKNRFVSELSEGQKRRVSLAIAFIHDPDILILDEPTVGVDIILSESIWKRLLELAEKGRTVIITTHSIHEAQQSHKIGLMRDGMLLAEDKPTAVTEQCGCADLEQAFIQLSYRQEMDVPPVQEYPDTRESSMPHFNDDTSFSASKVKGIMYKDIIILGRAYSFLLASFIIPSVSIVLFNLIIGNPPKDLHVAVVNEERSLTQCWSQRNDTCLWNDSDNYYVSCVFVKLLQNKSYKLNEYTDVNEAIADFKDNKVWAILHFPYNYTKALIRRFSGILGNFDEGTVDNSLLNFWLDKSNIYLSASIGMDLITSMLSFMQDILKNCDINPRALVPPINVQKPIFGSMDETFTSAAVVSFLMVISFTWACLSTSAFTMSEKMIGIVDRMSVAGATTFDSIASFFPIQFAVTLLSLLLTVFVVFGIFDNNFDGNMIVFLVLLMQIVVLGTLLGFFLSLTHTNIQSVMVSLTLLNTVLFFFTGIIRPIEEQQLILKAIGSALPFTWTINALQAIRFKNYSFPNPPVLKAFLGNTALIVIMVLILFYIVKYKKQGCIECMSTTTESATVAAGLSLF